MRETRSRLDCRDGGPAASPAFRHWSEVTSSTPRFLEFLGSGLEDEIFTLAAVLSLIWRSSCAADSRPASRTTYLVRRAIRCPLRPRPPPKIAMPWATGFHSHAETSEYGFARLEVASGVFFRPKGNVPKIWSRSGLAPPDPQVWPVVV